MNKTTSSNVAKIDTRGVRNCNPMNVRRGSPWKGQTPRQTDKQFCQFQSMLWGLRAGIMTLRTYVIKYRINTIPYMIARWAPPSDGNATGVYIERVADAVTNALKMTHDPSCKDCDGHTYVFTPIDFRLINGFSSDPLREMVRAMCKIESLYNPSDEEINLAISML